MTNKYLKILYATTVLSSKWTGGEPITARNTVKAFKDRGYDVVLAFYKSRLGDSFSNIYNNLRAYWFSSDSPLLSYLYYRKIIESEAPNVIIAQYDFDSSIVKAAIAMKKNIIVYAHIWWPICPKINLFTYDRKICPGFVHNNCKACLLRLSQAQSIPEGIFKLFLRFSTNKKFLTKMKNRINFLNADNVTIAVPTVRMKNYFANNGIYREKIKVVPNGLPCEEFPTKDISKQRIVGYYGGELSTKGYEFFLKVAEIIKPSHPDIRFIATGNFKNTSPFIDFVGILGRSELKDLMAKSRCTVVPGIWEDPFPLVILESMISGAPPVSFNIGIFNDMIQDGINGFTVPLGAVDDMADRILKLTLDDELFAKMSENARKRGCEFTEEKRITSLVEIINEI